MMNDHFTRYTLTVITKDQMAKTVAKVFYECFIAVFGALSTTVGIQKCRTMAYHAQCNGQVE